jgi:hypothetical protein
VTYHDEFLVVFPELMDDDAIELGDGEMVAIAVKGSTTVAANSNNDHDGVADTLVTSGVALTAGKHSTTGRCRF